MIKFEGKLSGTAEKFYLQKSVRTEQILLLSILALSIPGVLFTAIVYLSIPLFKLRSLLIVYSVSLMLIYLMPKLPGNAKSKREYMPNRISIEDQCIVLISNKHTDSKLIEHVKVVYDCGEYYDIRFPFGHYTSVPLICQKNLLTKGTIEEFEALFDGKIIEKEGFDSFHKEVRT